LGLAALGVMSADAAEDSGRVPFPVIPKAVKGEQCVEPVGVMRRLHGEYLNHQRDETMREGIRGKKYSLRQCIDCHAVPDPKTKDSEIRTVEPFCTACHEYAANTIDCFECHTTKAEKNRPKKTSQIPPGHPGKRKPKTAGVDLMRKYVDLSQGPAKPRP